MPDTSPDSQLAKPGPQPRGRASFWYVILLPLLPFFGLALLFWVGSTQWFLTHDAYPEYRFAGYAFRASGMNCEIVIYGDSSALTGLDPAIIQARTGLKTCNLAESIYVHTVVGSYAPLDYYLAHNRRPKYLIMMMSPTAFSPSIRPMTYFYPEGVVYALDYDRGAWLWKGLLRKPQWAFWFSGFVVRQIFKDLEWRLAGTHAEHWKVDERAHRDADSGLWEFPFPPETACHRGVDHQEPEHEENRLSVEAFRHRYAVEGTQVLIDATPAADCDLGKKFYVEHTIGLIDNKLEFHPISEFNQGDVHPAGAGTVHVSNEAADQILALMHRDKTSLGGQQAKSATRDSAPENRSN
jgi:hypothetical protein